MRPAGVLLAVSLLAAAGCAHEPAPATSVAVELFTVGFAGADTDDLLYRRGEGELARGANPDDRARQLAADNAAEIVLIHSTSWRWEPDGRIVLTYLAWVRDGALGDDARPLPRLEPPEPTDPLHPRPPEIRELDPLAHGLRHFAFLLRNETDGAVAAALGPRAATALARLEPAAAGQRPGATWARGEPAKPPMAGER